MDPFIVAPEPETLPNWARTSINLASEGLGARGVHATDDFFAPLERMLQDGPALFYPDRYDENGKWMDGWETRRRRGGGHDSCVVRLAAPGRILGFDVDTSHFTGNYPPACRIEACFAGDDPSDDASWVECLPTSPLGPSAHHFFPCNNFETWSHIRLNIYPDGGIARLRVYGVPQLDAGAAEGEVIDLASALNGARILAFSDAHYGNYKRLLAPGRGRNMGDGWETRRRREPGYDWMIIALGARGVIQSALVDTAHFKGNFPHSCSIQGADLSNFGDELTNAIVTRSMFWPELLQRQPLSADSEHHFDRIEDIGPITHVRLNIHPDGGISRLRLFGTVQ